MKYLFGLIMLTLIVKQNPIQDWNWVLSDYSFPPYFDLIKVDTQKCKVIIRFEHKKRIRTTINSKAYYLGKVHYDDGNKLRIKTGINHRIYIPDEECDRGKPSKIEFKLMLAGTYIYAISGDTLKLKFRSKAGQEGSMTFVKQQ